MNLRFPSPTDSSVSEYAVIVKNVVFTNKNHNFLTLPKAIDQSGGAALIRSINHLRVQILEKLVKLITITSNFNLITQKPVLLVCTLFLLKAVKLEAVQRGIHVAKNFTSPRSGVCDRPITTAVGLFTNRI